MQPRFITCDACDGEGRDLRGITDEDHGPCPVCNGERVIEVQTERGGPTEAEPDRPYCKPDQSCCDFCCGN